MHNGRNISEFSCKEIWTCGSKYLQYIQMKQYTLQPSMIRKSLRNTTHVIKLAKSSTPRSSVGVAVTVVASLMVLGSVTPNIIQQTVWGQVGPTESEQDYVSSSQRGVPLLGRAPGRTFRPRGPHPANFDATPCPGGVPASQSTG